MQRQTLSLSYLVPAPPSESGVDPASFPHSPSSRLVPSKLVPSKPNPYVSIHRDPSRVPAGLGSAPFHCQLTTLNVPEALRPFLSALAHLFISKPLQSTPALHLHAPPLACLPSILSASLRLPSAAWYPLPLTDAPSHHSLPAVTAHLPQPQRSLLPSGPGNPGVRGQRSRSAAVRVPGGLPQPLSESPGLPCTRFPPLPSGLELGRGRAPYLGQELAPGKRSWTVAPGGGRWEASGAGLVPTSATEG